MVLQLPRIFRSVADLLTRATIYFQPATTIYLVIKSEKELEVTLRCHFDKIRNIL